MKKVLLVLVFIVSAFNARSQNPIFDWAIQLGSTSDDDISAITQDVNSDLIVIGKFQNTVDFDPGTGISNLTSANYKDGFMAKYDASGNFLWVQQFISVTSVYYRSIFSNSNGDIYVTGDFQGTADFDPGPNSFTLSAMGINDIFVAKFDLHGNFIWAFSIGGSDLDYSHKIIGDNYNNFYICGYFKGHVDFDPGTVTTSLFSQYRYSGYIAKYDSAGHLLWCNTDGVGDDTRSFDLTLDNLGHVYLVGSFEGQVEFDPVNGPQYNSKGWYDAFLSQFDTAGNYHWTGQIGGVGNENANVVACDTFGNIYFGGTFQFTCDVNPDTTLTYNISASDTDGMYFCKIDPAGNFLWAKQLDCDWFNEPKQIMVDQNGDIYIYGNFTNTIDFDPGSGIYNLTPIGGYECFVLHLSANGDFISAFQIGGAGNDNAGSFVVSPQGDIYSTGYFVGTAAFDPGPANLDLTSAGGWDAFIQKMHSGSVAVSDILNEESISLFPNPSNNLFSILFKQTDNYKIKFLSIEGAIISEHYFINTDRIYLQSPLSSGIYFVQIINQKGSIITKKFIKN
jgi:hypothetical protein